MEIYEGNSYIIKSLINENRWRIWYTPTSGPATTLSLPAARLDSRGMLDEIYKTLKLHQGEPLQKKVADKVADKVTRKVTRKFFHTYALIPLLPFTNYRKLQGFLKVA